MTSEEERVIFISEKLLENFNITSEGRIEYLLEDDTHGPDELHSWRGPEYFIEWLSSPEGIHAIKQKMIERGYSMYLDYNSNNNGFHSKEWCCDFFFPKKHQGKCASTEAEAVLAATEKALRSEV